jgi:predicted dehydrogenase
MADSLEQQAPTTVPPLRVGIIGLGRRWHNHYRPALLALRERFQISALCDQVQERAVLESRRLGCAAVAGPVELLERRDTDAVLLIDRQWHRLWPVEAASRLGKPCLCCDQLERDDGHADELHQQVQARGSVVMMAWPHLFTPAAATLRDLLDKRGARPQHVVCSVFVPVAERRRRKEANDPARLGPVSLALLSWCTSLLAGQPACLLATALPDGALRTLLLSYNDGQTMLINHHAAAGPARGIRLQVITDRGTIAVRLPYRVRWSDIRGRFVPRVVKGKPPVQRVLEQFHAAVTGSRPVVPDLAHAHRLLGWWRLAVRSQQNNQWIAIPGEQG